MRIETVNGLRGIAILGVVAIHTVSDHTLTKFPILAQIIGTGWFGVYLFFTLSGFVLYLPFAGGKALNVSQFYRRRIVRLYPLLLLSALIPLLFYEHLLTAEFWSTTVQVATVTFYFFQPDNAPPGNGALWSLAIEFYLSALFPMYYVAFKRWSPWGSTVIVWAASALLKVAMSAGLAPWASLAAANVTQAMSNFMIGMLVAHCYSQGRLGKISGSATATFVASAAAILLLLVAINDYRSSPLPFGMRLLVWPSLDVLLGIMLAAALALPVGVLNRLLCPWPLQLIGAMCFSIYVWHLPSLGMLERLLPDALGQVPYGNRIALLAGLLVISSLSYRFIEFPRRPWRELFLWTILMRGLSSARAAKPAQAAADPAKPG